MTTLGCVSPLGSARSDNARHVLSSSHHNQRQIRRLFYCEPLISVFKRLQTTSSKPVFYFRRMLLSNLFYVYILECADQSYYTGMTNWLERRMEEHHQGKDDTKYTAQRLPVKLVYYEWHQYVFNAIRREKQIKNWSRAKKIALIHGNFAELKKLSACQNRSHHSHVLRDKPNFLVQLPIAYEARMHAYFPRGSSNGFRENASYFLSLRYADQAMKDNISRAG